MTGLIAAATTLIALVPLVERVKPVPEAEPEPVEQRTDPGDLTGDIELRDVHFRCLPDTEKVLRGVSLRIRPGDYVALVGPSGSRKSTIYRLLLGAVRRPRSPQPRPRGGPPSSPRRCAGRSGGGRQHPQQRRRSSRLDTDEISGALRDAPLERDVRTMPMGLHTMLHEGGGGLSRGQRQRLLIARALASKPRTR